MPRKKKEFAVASGEPDKQDSGQQAATPLSTSLPDAANSAKKHAMRSIPRYPSFFPSRISNSVFPQTTVKGLERRAIILTGVPAWEECANNDYQARTFVLGATRAKQLLAVLQ
jgi:hypothetical protein